MELMIATLSTMADEKPILAVADNPVEGMTRFLSIVLANCSKVNGDLMFIKKECGSVIIF